MHGCAFGSQLQVCSRVSGELCDLTLFLCRLELLGLGLPHHTEPVPQPGQRSEHQQIREVSSSTFPNEEKSVIYFSMRLRAFLQSWHLFLTYAKSIFIYWGYLCQSSSYFLKEPLIASVFKSAFKSHFPPLVLPVPPSKVASLWDRGRFPLPVCVRWRACSCLAFRSMCLPAEP